MKVIFSPEARKDLRQIGDRISLDNRPRALSFVRELIEKARHIGELPRAFPPVPEFAHLGIRRRVHGSYLILYRITDDRVMILRILHGARDYPSLLGPDA